MPLEGAEDGLDGPDEHARVPPEIPLLEKAVRQFGVWLFAKADDLRDLWAGRGGRDVYFFSDLNVAEPGARPRRLNADGDDIRKDGWGNSV